MLEYQKEVEERSRVELDEKMNAYQLNTHREMERNERNRYVSLLAAERTNVKKDYQQQMLQLKERHKHAMDAAERAQREVDRVGYEQRQRHLEGLRRTADLQEELKRKEEVERKATQLERRQLQAEQLLVRKEREEVLKMKLTRQEVLSKEMNAYKATLQSQYRERDELLRESERSLEKKRTQLDQDIANMEMQAFTASTASSNAARVIEAEAALAAEARRTSTLGLELEQAREHLKLMTQSCNLDRETLLQRTRECADARDQVLALRKVTEELERVRNFFSLLWTILFLLLTDL